MEQLRLLDPFMIVGLGRISGQALLHTTQGITDLRGRMFRLPMELGELTWTLPVYMVHHPAFIDRKPEKTREWEEDLAGVLRILSTLKGVLKCR